MDLAAPDGVVRGIAGSNPGRVVDVPVARRAADLAARRAAEDLVHPPVAAHDRPVAQQHDADVGGVEDRLLFLGGHGQRPGRGDPVADVAEQRERVARPAVPPTHGVALDETRQVRAVRTPQPHFDAVVVAHPGGIVRFDEIEQRPPAERGTGRPEHRCHRVVAVRDAAVDVDEDEPAARRGEDRVEVAAQGLEARTEEHEGEPAECQDDREGDARRG